MSGTHAGTILYCMGESVNKEKAACRHRLLHIARWADADAKNIGTLVRLFATPQPWRSARVGLLAISMVATWHGTLNLLLMKKKNRMSDSLLLWE